MMEPLAVSVNEARRLLGGIGRTKLYELIKDGHLKPIKLGGRTLIRIDCIRRLMRQA
jgi:excisionase family DNA binding protein